MLEGIMSIRKKQSE